MNSQKSPDMNDSESKIDMNMDKDDLLIFNLTSLSSLKKNDKLSQKGKLLFPDDTPWILKSLKRYLNRDNRQKSSQKVLELTKQIEKRITDLLNEDYKFTLENKKTETEREKKLSPFDEKNNKEKHEKIRLLIHRYYIILQKAQIGVQNIKDTYSDNFTKNFFEISKNKMKEIVSNINRRFHF